MLKQFVKLFIVKSLFQRVQPKPVVGQATESSRGVDLDQLYLYIQEKVEQTWQVKGNEFRQQIQQIHIPDGMTKEEVEAIVAAALAGETATIKGRIDGLSTDLKVKGCCFDVFHCMGFFQNYDPGLTSCFFVIPSSHSD